jgi:hypothetical protein
LRRQLLLRRPLTASEDLYRTLQVAPNADLEAIHAAYRRLARLYHPDLNPRPEAAQRMRAINSAYRVLGDPHQRAAYDARRFLAAPRRTVAATTPRPRPVVVVADTYAPTPLQRRVDRVVAVLGVLLLIGIGAYAVLILPRASSPTTRVSISDRLRLDTNLHRFPGTVLVPPSTLAPFRDLPIIGLDATGQGIARYAVYYGDLTTGVASISGLIGREAFDASAPRLPNCPAEAAYCVGPGAGQSATDPPGVELFRAPDLVAADPAFAVHRVCCNGLFWSMSWYDAGNNMSYKIDLSRNVAAQFGGPGLTGDLAAARSVAALGTQLVQLP